MYLSLLDWSIIGLFFILSLGIGLAVMKQAGKDTRSFFLSDRNMPWWLLGVSMVATTFSSDTPNLVTDIVRQHGVSGNWVWWAFLLTGMLTVFVFAALWRRSGILTDLEFYEIRYSGRAAAFLRGFRALYLGVFFNILIMATVSLAAIKIGSVLLGLTPFQTLAIASIITAVYSSLGGLKSILLTDFFQFILAMAGTIAAACIIINRPEIGGLNNLLSSEIVKTKTAFFPDFTQPEVFIPLFLLPLAVQWWSVWYPGSEPGGGGYIAQRMLAAKNEGHAVGSTLFFNIAHYALRPWPWILIALASLIVYPNLKSLQNSFPHIDPSLIGHDLAYPAMIRLLPSGLLGMIVASLIAAYMSTISTHLNWGSSYVVHDFYRRFINPQASEKQLVRLGRWTTVFLMLVSALLALALSNALQAFNILLQVGAGTGLLFILRWFWWRINPYSEITAMIVSFLVAVYFELVFPLFFGTKMASHWQMLYGVIITTISWLAITFLTAPSEDGKLKEFYLLIKPSGPGWRKVAEQHGLPVFNHGTLPKGILMMVLGTCSIYNALFSLGYTLYGETLLSGITLVICLSSSVLLAKLLKHKSDDSKA
ncbi:MAG: Na+:solute symporter [Acidobacteria bacterium]|nr:MAG: Na+:solute symporter [Acidobacteriota bacterium]